MTSPQLPLSPEEVERYERQLLLPEVGRAGQERLKASHVAVIGAGGLGSILLPLLVGAGVGRVTLCDGDVVTRSNLPRQTLYTTEDLGRSKAERAAEHLRAMNPHCQLTSHATYLTEANADQLLREVDLILDASDNEPTRRLLDSYASQRAIPWLYTSVEGWQGQLALFLPEGRRYADLFPPAEETPAPPAPVPILASVPALLAAIASTEALKLLLGLPTLLADHLLLVDTLKLSWLPLRR